MKKIIIFLMCVVICSLFAACGTDTTATGSGDDQTTPVHAHEWIEASCTKPKTCTTCGETAGEAAGHDWRAATCTKPKTCTTCGETAGEAAGHDWKVATCTNPKTCTTCGETTGKATGHNWIAATCTESKWCSTCGKTEGVALGHDDNGSGVCTRCGIQLYNPAPPTFLYTHSGTISISTANISLQDSAVLYITLSYEGSVSYDCEPSNVITLSWGQFDYSGTVPLYITAKQNGTARIRIYETHYPDNYLTVNVTVNNHVSVDTSTASGILASMGMTEEQFRAYCQPLKRDIASSTSTIICDLRDYPANYVGECYRFVTTSGNQLGIEISTKGQSSDGYITYISIPNEDWQGYILLFDMRDDTYSPTISIGDEIYPYMIFTGVQTINGIDFVCFWLISVDKC